MIRCFAFLTDVTGSHCLERLEESKQAVVGK